MDLFIFCSCCVFLLFIFLFDFVWFLALADVIGTVSILAVYSHSPWC